MGRKESDGIRDKLNQLVPDTVDISREFGVVASPSQRVGMTWGDLLEFQAIQSGCKGNAKTLADTLDRAYGKVPQVNKNENLNMNVTYEDFLDKIALDEAKFVETGIVLPEESDTPEDPLAEFL